VKKNKIKLAILLVSILFITGCTVKLKNEDNEFVKNPITGQELTKNILCQPTEQNVINIYKDNNVDITQLPKCTEFSFVNGEYEGFWTTVFVKPLVWLIIQIGKIVQNYGLAIILTTLLIRGIMSPITKKSAEQSEKMKLAKPELDAIESKYKSKSSTNNPQNDQKIMIEKQQEIALIYKKHGINLGSGCILSFIQIPLFFAYYESILRLPAIFEEVFIGFNLGTNPAHALSNGQYLYILFVIFVSITTYFSFQLASADMPQNSQMKMMWKFMTGFIFFISFTLPVVLALYWITNSSFTIGQNLISKRRKKYAKNNS
jgi:YidC/Oxa1 family membrane protein insertase